MKILMINKFFYPSGGAETYFFALRDLLKKTGHLVIDFSMADERNLASDYSQYFIKKIDFNKKEGWFKDLQKAFHLLYSFEAARNLDALLKKEKPDVAHLHNFYFHLSPSIIRVLKKHKIPVVWTLHDYKLISPNYLLFSQGQVYENCKTYKYYNCFIDKCFKNNRAYSFLAMLEMYLHKFVLRSYQKVDLYIAPSKFMQNKVIEYKIPAKKVKQVYNFIDITKYQPSQQLGEGILYFGRLSAEKGLVCLLKAAQKLPEVKFTIVGEGEQKAKLQKYVKNHNLANVTFLGFKTGQELNDLIESARFVVLPSIVYENNPLSVLESFALAKPVIGSEIGGIPELVKNKQTGILFEAQNENDLAAKIKAYYDEADLIIKMGQNARQFVTDEFNQAKHLAQIIDIYRQF